MRKRQYTTHSVTKFLRILVGICVPLFLAYMGFSIYIGNELKNQASQYLVNTVELYVKDVDKTVGNISRQMSLLLMGDSEESKAASSYINILRSKKNVVEKQYAMRKLSDLFYVFSLEYGEEYNFFMFLADTSQYLRGGSTKVESKVYGVFQQELVASIEQQAEFFNSEKQSWYFFTAEGYGSCVAKLYRKDNVYIGYWVLAEDLLEPLNNLYFGDNSLVLLADENKQYLLDQGQMDEYGSWIQKIESNQERPYYSFFSNHLLIERKFMKTPMYVKLLVAGYDAFNQIFWLQLLLFVMMFSIFAVIFFSNLYLGRRVLAPVRFFSQELERQLKNLSDPQTIADSGLYELEKANSEFRHLLDKVRGLETEIYQQNLEKQSIQLDYLKLQLKPHFFLNCLNFIYNMVDLGEGENAKKMSMFTSDYLRFLFKNGMDYVYVHEELSHVENYLAIFKMRYRFALEYYIEQEESTRQAVIPPMIIQIFVENSIKHTVNLDKRVNLSVTVFPEYRESENYMMIIVADTGKGFPPDVLEKLKQRKEAPPAAGQGIGIENCLRRIEYYYGTQAEIEFYNGPTGGAVVQLCIPMRTFQPGEKRGDSP